MAAMSNPIDVVKGAAEWAGHPMALSSEHQLKAKRLCREYNLTEPDDIEGRQRILESLLGDAGDHPVIEPDFRCDYGFNIHLKGFAFMNYNCVILDTSPVNIGAGVLIAPGVCIACAGHSLDLGQRMDGVETSAPITIEDGVWLGANATVCGGVTIGKGSVIGAGSVVTHDVPAGVVAVGAPCRPIRAITDEDRIDPARIAF